MLTIDPKKIQFIDDRRDIAIPGDQETTVQFAVDHWIRVANQAIQQRSRFAVALSGGTTPNIIYETLASKPYSQQIDWSKVYLFWSDERAVLPTDVESNYLSAMTHGFSRLPIPSSQIFRMETEKDIQQSAQNYEAAIKKHLHSGQFDLVMLGIGPDGHTASLFPHTSALQVHNRLVVANYIEEKRAWRMTLTIPCINQSRLAVFYVLGSQKKQIIDRVLHAPAHSPWPASQIGLPQRKSLWIADKDAAEILIS